MNGAVKALLGAAIAIVAAHGVSFAQDASPRPRATSAIVGRITDERHVAIPGVEVMLRELSSATTLTNDSGRFVLGGLSEGSYHLVVRRVGYEARSFVAKLIADDTLLVDNLELKAAATKELPAVEVRDQTFDNPFLAEFEARRRSSGAGTFIAPAEIAKTNGAALSNILVGRMPELKRIRYPVCAGGGVAIAGSGSPPISAGSIDGAQPQLTPRCKMQAACYSQIWINGTQVYAYGTGGLPPNIDSYQSTQIDAIEIYARGGETPAQYNSTGSACGTILLWTKR